MSTPECIEQSVEAFIESWENGDSPALEILSEELPGLKEREAQERCQDYLALRQFLSRQPGGAQPAGHGEGAKNEG